MKPLLVLVVIFSAMTGLLMGFDLSVIAVILGSVSDKFSLCKSTDITCFSRQIFVSSIAPGALLGSIWSGYAADYLGRKLTLVFSDVCFIFGSGMMMLAESFKILLLGRMMIGVGLGIGFVVFSTYVTEVSPSEIRGRLVLCQEVAQCIGVILIFVVTTIIGDEHWRVMLGLGGLMAIIQLAAVPGLPESPYWLILNDQKERAFRIMQKLGINDPQITEIVLPTNRDSNRTFLSSFNQLFRAKYPLLIACFVGIIQNILCTNAVLYYSTDLFLLGGVCKWYAWGPGLGIVKFIGTIVTFYQVDRIGRRKLLIGGTLGIGLFHLILAAAYAFNPANTNLQRAWSVCHKKIETNALGYFGTSGFHSWIMLFGIFGFVFFWEISWAGLMFVVASELLPSEIRGTGMGIVIFCFWISMFASQYLFEAVLQQFTVSVSFISLSVLSCISAIITYSIVPELAGCSLLAFSSEVDQNSYQRLNFQ